MSFKNELFDAYHAGKEAGDARAARSRTKFDAVEKVVMEAAAALSELFETQGLRAWEGPVRAEVHSHFAGTNGGIRLVVGRHYEIFKILIEDAHVTFNGVPLGKASVREEIVLAVRKWAEETASVFTGSV